MSPLKKKIASDIHDIFSCETVAVVHYGDLNTQAWNTLRLKLAETGMKIQVIPTKVATRALDDSHVQNITALFKGSTALVYGDFHQTNSLLTCIKSEPKLCLLGGKVLNKLVTPQGLEEVYSKAAITRDTTPGTSSSAVSTTETDSHLPPEYP